MTMRVFEHVQSDNLSRAWLKAMYTLTQHSTDTVGPLIVTIAGLDNNTIPEVPAIRSGLDSSQLAQNRIERVANTIFPSSLWNRNATRQLLFDRFIEIWQSTISKCRGNGRGHYFQRLIAYDNGDHVVNQLEHIILTWQRGNHRHSALQAAIFDPRKDHTDSLQLNFPCLHQVAFDADLNDRSLSITAFYANQNIYLKGYGNYLGLCRLGQFMAHEMGLEIRKLQCVASRPNPELGKSKATVLLKELCSAAGIEPAGIMNYT
jgi:hypothetical protein